MTKKEAQRILRRYQNWRKGRDIRNFADIFPEENPAEMLSGTIELFAAENGKIDCRACSHCLFHEDTPMTCGLEVKGECKRYKRANVAIST